MAANSLSLEQFRESGRDVASIADYTQDADLVDVPGRIYQDSFYIQRWVDDRFGIAPPDGPTWLLTLENEQFEDKDLSALESRLYDWVLIACYFEGACQ